MHRCSVYIAIDQSVGRPGDRILKPVPLQDIYLQKNGTSQLGVTLGYDSTAHGGCLYVCEVSNLANIDIQIHHSSLHLHPDTSLSFSFERLHYIWAEFWSK